MWRRLLGARPARRKIVAGLLWLLGLLPGMVHAQALPIPGVRSTASTAADADTLVDNRSEIRRRLADAQARLEVIESGADTPPSAPAVEIAERVTLARQLLSLYQQQLEVLDRAASARRAGDEALQAARAWTGFATPPPRSVLVVDALRDELDAASDALTQAQDRMALLARIDTGMEGRLRASQAAARRAEERAGSATGTPGAAGLEWQRALASLRASVDGATQALLQMGARAARLEADAAQARIELVRRKIADAGSDFALPHDDLQKVTSELDARRLATAREMERATRESTSAGEALAKAERRVRDGAGSDGDRVRELEILREVAGVAAQHANLLRERLMQIDGEKAVWEGRAKALAETDPVAARAAYERVATSLAGVRTGRQYLERELAAAVNRTRAEEARAATDAPGASGLDRRMLESLRARESNLRRAIDNSRRLERLLSRFQADLDARREASLTQRVHDLAAAAMLGARRVWDFELLTIDDSLETADGRRIPVTRSVTVGRSLGAALVLVVGYLFSSVVVRRVEHFAVRRGNVSPQSAALVRGWLLFVIAAALLVVALVSASIPLTAFAFLGGALAIAAGFGLQNLLKNLVAGVMLLLERPLRLGDLVEVDGIRGRITRIGVRASTIRTPDGIESMIPNSRFVEGNVTNWTFSSAATRQTIKVGVTYGTDLRRASTVLGEVLGRHELVLKVPAPQVYLEEFGADSIDFALTYWVEMTASNDSRRVRSDLMLMIDQALTDAGLSMPFAQRDVHLDAVRPIPVEVVHRSGSD